MIGFIDYLLKIITFDFFETRFDVFKLMMYNFFLLLLIILLYFFCIKYIFKFKGKKSFLIASINIILINIFMYILMIGIFYFDYLSVEESALKSINQMRLLGRRLEPVYIHTYILNFKDLLAAMILFIIITTIVNRLYYK
ncbi:hypothetical protein, partial [Staphylococcus warneri]